MKRFFPLLLILFVFIINSNLYAFDNKHFSVKENGWKITKKTDEVVLFEIEDFEKDNENFIVPNVGVKIEKNEKPTVVEYTQEELNTFKSSIEKKAYKDYYNDFKAGVIESLENRLPNSSKKQREEMVKEIFSDSGIKSTSYKNIGNSKAHTIEFLIGTIFIRRFVVVKLNYTYVIEFTYAKNTDIDSLKPYKDFVSSFKAKDYNPTTVNAYIHGGALWKIVSKVLGLLVLGAVAAIAKKRNS